MEFVWTSDLLDQLLKGRWVNKSDFIVHRATSRVRNCEPKSLFIAMTNKTFRRYMGDCNFVYYGKKKNYDTHRYIKNLAKEGKLGAVIVEYKQKDIPEDIPQYIVQDSFKALEALAAYYKRRQLHAKVIAITGTVGKTSTKTMLRSLLEEVGKVTVDKANVRSALCESILLMDTDADYLILEVSQSALWFKDGGVSHVIRPDISIITEIGLGQAHKVQSEFETAVFKSNLFNFMEEKSTVVLNRDMKYFDWIKEKAIKKGLRVISYGFSSEADVYVTECTDKADRQEIGILGLADIDHFVLPELGKGGVYNSLASIVTMKELGVLNKTKLAPFERYKSSDTTEKIEHFQTEFGVMTVIVGSLSAEKLSMINALKLAANLSKQKEFIACLGQIVALGTSLK